MNQQVKTFELTQCQADDMASREPPTYEHWCRAKKALQVVAGNGSRGAQWKSVQDCSLSLEIVSAYMCRKGAAVEAYAALATACALRGSGFVRNHRKTAAVALEGFRFFNTRRQPKGVPTQRSEDAA